MKDYSKHCGIYFEHSIDDENWSYLVIFGYHINGAFIAIPNWKICVEASDLEYNENKLALMEAGLDESKATTVSNYINNWIKDNADIVENRRKEQEKLYQEYLQEVLKPGLDKIN